MKKTWINFCVALSMFISMTSLAGIGLILKFVLPPGSGGGLHGPGRGGGGLGAKTLLGMTRHEWGDIHFYIAAALVSLLAIHIYMHWPWIKCRLNDLKKSNKTDDCDD